MAPFIPGTTFGYVTVVAHIAGARYLCRCVCGKQKEFLAGRLLRAGKRSCGCKANLRHFTGVHVGDPAKFPSRRLIDWSDAETATLVALVAAGHGVRKCSTSMKINRNSIRRKMVDLGMLTAWASERRERVRLDQWPAGMRFEDHELADRDKAGRKPQRMYDRSLIGNSSEQCAI